MKSIKIIICLLFLQGIFGACSDFLEIRPTSIYSVENLFKTTDQVVLNVKGIYSQLVADALYGRNMVMYYDQDNDVMQISNTGSTGAPDGERRSIARYSFTETTKQLDNAWTALYSGIERANIAIDKIPAMDLYTNGTDAQKSILKRCYGESLTLRGIMYFDLIRLWGDVPFKTKPSAAGENFNLPRTSRDTIYDHIIKDMILAVDLVPWANEIPFNERITKGAVKGILARVCLHAAGYSLRWDLNAGSNPAMALRNDNNKIREFYTIAKNQCSEIMASGVHKLNPSFLAVWQNICSYKLDQTYKENIFELGFYSLAGLNGQAGNFGRYNGPVSDATSLFKKGSGGNWAMPNFYLSFLPGDVRRDVSISDLTFPKNDIGKGIPVPSLTYLSVAKWRKEWSPDYPVDLTNFNYPMLRYSDVLLMFAEADSWLNNGSTASAVDALKQVRRRAFPNAIATINAETYPSDLTGFLNVIDKERGFELAFEGFRKFDLIRWNKLASRISETKTEIASLKASITSSGLNKPYNGSITQLVGTIFPKVRWYRDEGGKFVTVVTTADDKTPPVGTGVAWKSVEWVGSKFGTYMEYFAVGFEVNKSEIFPIPKVIRDVSPALSQIPGY